MKVEMEREWTISLLRCSNIMQKHEEEWAGEHFIFWASFLGPLRVNPPICINYTANYDGVNGWYYQIGVIKYNFLDYERYSNSLSSGCYCHIVPKAAGLIFHSSHSNSLANSMKCMLHSMG